MSYSSVQQYNINISGSGTVLRNHSHVVPSKKNFKKKHGKQKTENRKHSGNRTFDHITFFKECKLPSNHPLLSPHTAPNNNTKPTTLSITQTIMRLNHYHTFFSKGEQKKGISQKNDPGTQNHGRPVQWDSSPTVYTPYVLTCEVYQVDMHLYVRT